MGTSPVLRAFYRKYPYSEKYAKYRKYAPGALCLAALLTAAPLRAAAGDVPLRRGLTAAPAPPHA